MILLPLMVAILVRWVIVTCCENTHPLREWDFQLQQKLDRFGNPHKKD